jgi:enoyl-CoA hydratase/carnithine racemase
MSHQGKAMSWEVRDGVLELALHREPLNEIGSATLEELEQFAVALESVEAEVASVIIYSPLNGGFSAGADLRELYFRGVDMPSEERIAGVRDFLTRIHHVLNTLDASPLTTIAAVHGVTFGGGFEVALACDLIIADRTARFAFPELRLGLIPGFGGIPRLKRDLGNAVVRDLILTGRSFNVQKAQQIGLVSQVCSEGEVLHVARMTATQVAKFDRHTSAAAKQFIKPIPHDELAREIDLFCELYMRPAVEEGLRKFVESTEALPYLP